jgi:hypothetical protein
MVDVWAVFVADPEGAVVGDDQAFAINADAAVPFAGLSKTVTLIRGRRKNGKARI